MKLNLLSTAAAALCLLITASPAAARERTMYSVQQLGAIGITTFEVDLDSGALTQQPGVVAVGLPTVPSISSDGSHLFVSDYNGNTIHSFTTNPTGPVAVPGGSAASGVGPNAVIASPTDNHLWTANYGGNGASGFSVSGGVPTALSGFPVASGSGPTTLAVSPRHNFVYLPGSIDDVISGFTRGNDGSLTPLAGSPFARSGSPIDVEFTPDGERLYVALSLGTGVAGYSIDQSTGALTELSGSPWIVGSSPVALAATPDGEHLLLADSGGGLSSLAIAGDGSLTVTGSGTTGNTPNDVTVTPDGRFVYVANLWSGTISGFELASDGSLTALSGSPFGDASGAIASFAIVPNQGPLAAFTAAATGSNVSLDASAASDSDGSISDYHWDYGDGHNATGGPAATHSYSAPGTYNVTLTVTDDEGCSTTQIGTGQTLYCNGSTSATVQHPVTITAPTPPALTLTRASGKQAKSRRNGRKVTRRVRTRFTLSEKANVTYRFQKSLQGGTCRSGARTAARHKIRFRNFGRSMTRPARAGSNQRTFARSLGGRRLTTGRYRVILKGRTSDGRESSTVTTKSFCVR